MSDDLHSARPSAWGGTASRSAHEVRLLPLRGDEFLGLPFGGKDNRRFK